MKPCLSDYYVLLLLKHVGMNVAADAFCSPARPEPTSAGGRRADDPSMHFARRTNKTLASTAIRLHPGLRTLPPSRGPYDMVRYAFSTTRSAHYPRVLMCLDHAQGSPLRAGCRRDGLPGPRAERLTPCPNAWVLMLATRATTGS